MDVWTAWIICLALSITTSAAPSETVTGSVNDTLSLPCRYTVQGSNVYYMCWGQGHCSFSRCNNEIMWTDGYKVTWRKSDRYQLLGNINQGDVSLTITEATREDEGTYCCRVEIPGLFNDLKTEVGVKMQEGRGRPLSVTTVTTDHHPMTIEEDMFSMLEECPDDED
ncbi:hepatitis A virus cellular receptor 1 homolog [Phyllobates terribilis]|uniref:hepatitis A virus cellular receptor 1 homolog n=1 Tax=Phyllobates terribilis TaxID=111132 RepID=UPI003CCA77E8